MNAVTADRLEVAAASVRREVERGQPLTPAERRLVEEGFFLELHLRAIGAVCEFASLAVSFRAAGTGTLRCLEFGAPTKGPDLHNKTIKLGSLAAYSDAQALLHHLQAAEIDGYVGHWDSRNRLVGLVMGPGAKALQADFWDGLQRMPGSEHRCFPIDLGAPDVSADRRAQHLSASLAPLKSLGEHWRSLPFTGDYDMHDMFIKEGRWLSASDATAAEKKIQAFLNTAVAAVDPKRPFDRSRPDHPQSMVRHGAQNNYPANALSAHPRGLLLRSVAEPSFPLAMCDAGHWKIIASVAELHTFYASKGCVLKSSWNPAAVSGMELAPGGQPNTVVLRHRRPVGTDSAA